MATHRKVAVYGAYGYTGRFVVAELLSRGWMPVLGGRDRSKLDALAAASDGLESRRADVDDPASLDAAIAGTAAVINCAGPFARTSEALIEAALRARIPYFDVAAEIEVTANTFANYADRARDAGIAIVPAMAFYGGLGDLLATAAMGDWESADEISIAYALSSWHPTLGTRATSAVSTQRRNGRRPVFSSGRMEFRTGSAPASEWRFPAPLGVQAVVGEFTTADAVTISHHVHVPEIRSFMTTNAVLDISSADTPLPTPVDGRGRSSQTFLVEVVARRGNEDRRATARGQDIYAATAPLIVEAMDRVLNGACDRGGVFAAGEVFDARDFLAAVLNVEYGVLNPRTLC